MFQKKLKINSDLKIPLEKNGWKINFGTGIEYVTFKNNTFQKIIYQNISDTLEFESELNFVKTSFFGQISKKSFR